jgi:ribosomal protein S28E/S33
MAARTLPTTDDLAATVFARSWASVAERLTPALARQVLRLGFSEDDQVRMHLLAERNAEGLITRTERSELDGFVRVGDMIAILQSAARRKLKPARSGKNGHG